MLYEKNPDIGILFVLQQNLHCWFCYHHIIRKDIKQAENYRATCGI